VECWIGVTTEGECRVVRVAGRLSLAHLPEMLEACTDGAALQIDLTDLVSADMAGIEALQRLRARGASIIGAPGYIQLKLDLPAAGAANPAPPRIRHR
jgi:CheY-like chemotaxis protein